MRFLLPVLALLLPSSAFADSPLPVEVVTVRETALTFDTTLAGSIEAEDSVEIGFRQGGRVTEVLVNEGDRVRRGQPLARTDPTQQEQALHVAQAHVASTKATHIQTRLAFERAQAMLKHGVGTRAALDNAAQAVSAAEGAEAQATTELEQAQRAVDDTVLRAPTDAVVTGRSADPGQIVAVAQSVISLASTSGLEAVFQTPDLPMLDNALGAQVTLSGIDVTLPPMTATVREISPLVDPKTGAVTVKALIDDAPANAVLFGVAVRGTIHLPVGQGIEIPWTALNASGEDAAVWRLDDDNKAHLIPVRIDRFTTHSVVLSTGIAPGDRIVGAGSQLLYPDRPIEVAK